MPEALFFGGSGFYCARLQTSACPFSLPADSGSNISFRTGPAQRSAEGALPGKTSLSVPLAPRAKERAKKRKGPPPGEPFESNSVYAVTVNSKVTFVSVNESTPPSV